MVQMTTVLDVAGLPVGDISNQAPIWWGQFLLALIEASMFFILLAMYFYIRLSYDMWPPPGIQLPRVGLATISLVPLVISALGCAGMFHSNAREASCSTAVR